MLTNDQKIFVFSKVCNQAYNKEKITNLLNKVQNREGKQISEVVTEWIKNDKTASQETIIYFSGALKAIECINEKDFKFFGV